MNSKLISIAFCSLIVLTTASVRALPTLQLDIANGKYSWTDETTYATTPQFTLRALLNGATELSGGTGFYYISAAIQPMLSQSTPPPDVGTFKINGTVFSTAGLSYGKPPVDVSDTGSGNLAPHGEFPTYYAEVSFNFDLSHTVGAYNTQDGTSAPGVLYYHDFSVDVSGLMTGYSIHFDLYDEQVKKATGGGKTKSLVTTTTYTIDDFAPFSHDAQSGPTDGHVPDGGTTVILLGVALTSLAAIRRLVHS